MNYNDIKIEYADLNDLDDVMEEIQDKKIEALDELQTAYCKLKDDLEQ